MPHDEPFQYDDLNPFDIQTRISGLKKAGKYTKRLSRTQIRDLHAGLPTDYEPCEDFRRMRAEMLDKKRIRSDLDDFQDQEIGTQEFG
jgi:hypothetical protein